MNHCQFWVQRKARFCKMRPKGSNNFCGEHMVLEQNSGDLDDNPRIPCPYDPAQYFADFYISESDYIGLFFSSASASELEKHMKKCNARPGPIKPYFSENINVLGSLATDGIQTAAKAPENMDDGEAVLIKGMEPEDYRTLIEKLRQARQRLDLEAARLRYCLDAEHKISDVQKDNIQKEAISNLIFKNQFNNERLAVVEMGCGKGGLSHHLITNHPKAFEGAHFYLVDRDNFKGKLDNKASAEATTIQVERVKIDIKDLDLDALLPTNSDIDTVLVISKHLCGAATCLTLAAVANLLRARPALKVKIAVALCCHHRCTADMYCWQGIFDPALTISLQDFTRLCGISSWAVCGWRYGQKEGNRHYSGYSYDECTQIGLECKELLNYGRIRFLQSIGFDANLEPYISPDITLENQILLASNYA